MQKPTKVSGDSQLFAALTAEELDVMTSLVWRVQHEPGEVIFREGDAGEALFVVLDGRVEVHTRVSEGVKKGLLIVKKGELFGELSVITGEDRSATATATEKTTLLSIDRMAFKKLSDEKPVIAKKLLEHLLFVVAERLYITTGLFRQAADWGLTVSGVSELAYHNLVEGRVRIAMDLLTGQTVEGVLLRSENKDGEREFLVANGERLVIVPYHAVASFSFLGDSVIPEAAVSVE